MPIIPPEDYGLKVLKPNQGEINTKERKSMSFSSATAGYLEAYTKIVKVNANPYVVVHGLGYIPRVIIKEILSDHDRKLPYDDGVKTRDFSVTENEIKIRGVTSGTFEINIYGQPIL